MSKDAWLCPALYASLLCLATIKRRPTGKDLRFELGFYSNPQQNQIVITRHDLDYSTVDIRLFVSRFHQSQRWCVSMLTCVGFAKSHILMPLKELILEGSHSNECVNACVQCESHEIMSLNVHHFRIQRCCVHHKPDDCGSRRYHDVWKLLCDCSKPFKSAKLSMFSLKMLLIFRQLCACFLTIISWTNCNLNNADFTCWENLSIWPPRSTEVQA